MTKKQSRKRAFRGLRSIGWSMARRKCHVNGTEREREAMSDAELRECWGSQWGVLKQSYK